MSVKVDDFELNLNVDPIQPINNVNGEKSFELTAGIDISVAETLMEPSVFQDGVGECSINDVVNEVRVSEGKGTSIGDGVVVNDGGIDLGLDGEVPKFDLVEGSVDSNVISNFVRDDEEKIKVSQLPVVEPNMISLVVDLNSCEVPYGELKFEDGIGDQETEVRIDNAGVNKEAVTDNELSSYVDEKNVMSAALEPRCYVEECCAEKEGEFDVCDLVWGKVRSHPWWPGQLFDPTASSNMAMKYFRKDRFLIAYFGDQTFAWNEASQIKPFRMHFAQMVKQSNMDSFCCAVNCALDEVSRRVEFGLACSCLSEVVYAKIKSQCVANGGIREESSRRDGGDKFSSVASFIPAELVQYLKALAEDPFGGTDRLEFVVARAQLLAFNRWKGYNQLATLNVLDGLLENDADGPVLGKEKDPNEVIENANTTSKGDEKVREKKRKQNYDDVLCARKKEKRVSDLMSESCSNLKNGENRSQEKAGRKMSSKSSDRKGKVVDFICNDSRVESRKRRLSPVSVNKVSSPPRKFTKIGERIRRIASQLSGSTPNLKHGDRTSQEAICKHGLDSTRVCQGDSPPEKSGVGKVIPAEYPPVDEMLSRLYLAATDPMNGHSLLFSIVSFFSDFRNQVSLANSSLQKEDKSDEKVCDEQTGKSSPIAETTETSVFEGMEDSYWTDRIIQGNPDEQVLFEPEIPETIPIVEPEAALDPMLESVGYKQENTVVNLESEAEKKLKEYSPTALILNFSDLNSVPSETNLNKIFCRYGPLNEMETEVMKKSSRAKVVFKRRCDAETAFSSAGKFSIFGPSLVSYRLNYSPTPRKASTPSKRNRKDANANAN